ncbi:MAG TPA: Flp pilus assembly protein CpaB [Albitalea sp.]|nr:Flp pilus assembly protein CpaB [Albitalea sp.]
MRSRGLWMLLLALVAGLGAVLLAARWMQQQGGEKSRIAVASTDIALGARITPDMVRLTEWPRTSVPEGAFTEATPLDGRVAVSALHRGEPVLQARLAPVGTQGGLAAVVPEGKRAMTVRVNDVVGVGGFVLPGTFVDIMVNTQGEGATRGNDEKSVSKIVLERLLVLAVAQEANRDETKPKVVNAVTLEVTPAQAEVLDLARSVGNLSLVLRNQTDPAPVQTAGATKAMLLGLKPVVAAASAPLPSVMTSGTSHPAPRRVVKRAAPPAPAAPRGDCVEIIRGPVKSIECF